MNDATGILEAIDQGDFQTAEQPFPLVYAELRKLAAVKMANEAPGQTLQATALVHEVWIKLPNSERQQWRSRAHFSGAAAEAMRRILIDKARRKASNKHGAGQPREELNESQIAPTVPTAEMLAVHEALDALSAEDDEAAMVVKLKYFVGMTHPEIAAALNISLRSVDRNWAFARAWLRNAIKEDLSF